tara:strand:- start:59 stop:811 length:753 start_codon:yes stop_codon:yes gene_type:complete
MQKKARLPHFFLLQIAMSSLLLPFGEAAENAEAASSSVGGTTTAKPSVCDATKQLYLDRACCGSSSGKKAICTAPTLDLRDMGEIGLQLTNVSTAQANEKSRDEQMIKELLGIDTTTKTIDQKTEEIQHATNRTLETVAVDHTLFLEEGNLDIIRHLLVPTSYNSTKRLRILGSEVFANKTVKVWVRNLENPCTSLNYYVHPNSSITTTTHNRRLMRVRRNSNVFNSWDSLRVTKLYGDEKRQKRDAKAG